MRSSRSFRTDIGIVIAITVSVANFAATEGWEHRVRRAGIDPASIEDPLATTEEMRRTARSVIGAGSDLDKLNRLQAYLFDDEEFPFDYASRETYTAIEAFEKRTGNCVSFTNLFIALARSAGLPTRAALITQRPDSEREGDLIVVNNHIVAVFEHSGGATVFDFNFNRNRARVGLHLIDEAWITAIHLNNRGSEELIADRPHEALGFVEAAVLVAPDFALAYGNLGVIYRKLGQSEQAYRAYREALELEPRLPTILNNLAALYQSEGRHDEARTALLAANLRGATPYFLILRGDFELADGRPRAARKLFRQAARNGPDLPEPQVAIARAELARGRQAAALTAVDRALRIDPLHAGALRLKAELHHETAKGDRKR